MARQTLVRRQGRLENLKSLKFRFYMQPRMPIKDPMALFVDCPGIEFLAVPLSSAHLEPVVLGRFIAQHCSKLREVRVPRIPGDDALLSTTILTSMAPHTLQPLQIYDCEPDPIVMSAIMSAIMSIIIDHHSSSLRKITLLEYPPMTSPLIQKILSQCSELEELTLYLFATTLPPLTLTDATIEPWATTKLRKLQPRVTVPDLFYLQQKK